MMQDELIRPLLQRLQTGDAGALEELYQNLSTPVYTLILRITGNTALSEDILQEFFVKLYRSPPAELPRKPRAYLFQMAHNLTVDCLRKEAQTLPLEDALPMPAPFPSLSERLDLERALNALLPADREIVTLHAVAGLTFREIAGILSMPLGTVLWRYQRAIGRLRNLLNGGIL